jgi:signal transduction histidine kinase
MQRAEAHSAASARLTVLGRIAVSPRVAGPARVAAGLAGLAAGTGALAVAAGPGHDTTYAGSSAAGAALTLFAGVGLIAAGLVMSLARRSGRTGDLALLAGLCWFAPVWMAWHDGPPLVPSLAMVVGGFTFALVVHLVLTHPNGTAGSKPARVLASVIYAEALLTAATLALFRDPYFDPGCWANCTANEFLVRSMPLLSLATQTADRWFAATAALALIAVCSGRLARASRPARQRLLPVYLPAIGFAATVIARAAELQRTTIEDPFNDVLLIIFACGSGAVTLLALGLISGVARTRAELRAVARIAANVNKAPAPGLLQSALAEALRDPGLQIAYWLPGRNSYVDASGQMVPEPAAEPSRSVTRVTRNQRTIAAISHSGAVPEIETRIGSAIRLGLENERLQAELLAQIGDLRASRARIVETADAERRMLERNLHDGAQQGLLALSYDIRLARASAESDGDTHAERTLAGMATEIQSVLAELRELAHGIYPAILAEAGLGPALATLADTAPVTVQIVHSEDDRHPATAEAAAYFAVAEAIGDAARRGAEHVAVKVSHEEGRLIVTVEANGSSDVAAMVQVADRVGALGGSLLIGPNMHRAEIPCE